MKTARMKISESQVFWLLASMEIGMTMLLTITPAYNSAKQDAWLSTLTGGLIALGITFLAVKLSQIHPTQTLIEFSQTILGKWVGKVIVVPYLVQWYVTIAVILRQSGDFLHVVLFQKTPLWVLILSMLILVVYVTYSGGIEGIGRCSELVGPVIFVTIAGVCILNYGNMDWHRLTPVYADSGWLHILRGSVFPASFLGESIMYTMFFVFVRRPDRGPGRALFGVGMASLFVTCTAMVSIMTFASLVGKQWYPFFDVTRFVSVMEFIQNVDALVVIVWVLSVFIKLALYMFISTLGTAQWLGIQDWRKPVWYIAVFSFAFSFIWRNVDQASVEFPNRVWIPYVMPINMVGIPLLLLVVGLIRKRDTSKNPKNKQASSKKYETEGQDNEQQQDRNNNQKTDQKQKQKTGQKQDQNKG